MQRDKLRGRAGIRAKEFEMRIREGRRSVLAKKCWEEIGENRKRRDYQNWWKGGVSILKREVWG